MLKFLRAIFNPTSFWREILRCGWIERRTYPVSWFDFRHTVGRELAMRKRSPLYLPNKSLEDILGIQINDSTKIVYDAQTPYNLSWSELVILSQMVVSLKPLCIFEIGTFNGRTTLHLALNSPASATVITVDLGEGGFDFGGDTSYFKPTKVGSCFHNNAVAERKITQVIGDSHTLDFSRWKNSVDFIFIDGDHSYNGVLKDSELAFSLIRRGGVILWHDYLMINDVTNAITHLSKKYPLCRVAGTSLVIWRNSLPEARS